MGRNQSGQAAPAKARPLIPLPGQRILRSVLSIWCCVAVYYLRGRQGMTFFSIISALQCVQPYTENVLKVGKNRIRGTLVGAFWGTIVVFGELNYLGRDVDDTLIHYLLLGLFSGIVLYSTVLLKITDSSYFSTVVFLSISMNHLGDENPWIYIFDRTLDTAIGVGIGLLVCALHLPRLRDRTTLFVSGIDHVLFRQDRRISPFTKVQLNRFIQDGMLFSVSTRQTPATVRELLAGVDLRLPIIAMDGAVLYDLNTRKYLVTYKLDEDLVLLATDFLHRQQMPFFVNTVEDNLLVIYYRDYRSQLLREVADISGEGHLSPCSRHPEGEGTGTGSGSEPGPGSGFVSGSRPDSGPNSGGDFGLASESRSDSFSESGPESGSGAGPELPVSRTAMAAMHRLYIKKNVSPYRNYVRTDSDKTKNVLYLLVIDKKERIDLLYAALQQEPWFTRCRPSFDTFDCEEDEMILRIYPAKASRASMLAHLCEYVGTDKTVTFGATPGECDVLIREKTQNHMVKELKKRFQPVSLRGWKNILRL